MSERPPAFVKAFFGSESDPGDFADEFISQWRHERDTKVSLSDAPKVSEALSSIFCLADMFNPNDDREDYEFDEPKLRLEIEEVLRTAELL